MLRSEIDHFTVEIVRCGLVATTDEMKNNLMRTAYSSIVYEAQDFTVALTDREGNLVSIGLGLPSFIRGISDTVKAFVKFFGSDIHPGDILLTNDAYIHGSHLYHVIVALPIFHEGEIIAFSCSEPHWEDIGGVLRGFPTDIYSEGLQLPPVKIYNKGVLNKEIASIISANVRNPDKAMGDFRGQIACVRTGENRILHMARKYGKGTFLKSLDAIMKQSELFARNQLLTIPDGTYEAEQFLDDDGIDIGVHMRIKLKIVVKEDSMTVDLSDVGHQVRGAYNSGAGISGVQMGFKTIISPLELPVNDGSFRPLNVILPPGTFVSAQKPSPMRWWMVSPMNIADTMWKALAPAIPQKIMAGHFATLPGGGGGAIPLDRRTGRPIGTSGGVGGGGGGGFGAKYNEDGMSATFCLNDGDTHNTPVESGEAHNPRAMVVRLQLRQDSGGPGRFRGGLGSISEVVLLTDSITNSYMERSTCAPWGAFDAKAGLANALRMGTPKDSQSTEDSITQKILSLDLVYEDYPNPTHPNTKIFNKRLPAGSRVILMTGGGGGFGNPFERDVLRVHSDVINGYVSLKSALGDYGVVIDPETFKVDEAKTSAIRERFMLAQGKSEPTKEA